MLKRLSSKMAKEDVSIVIVGAGAAGFATAVKLMENGFSNVTILEAENRIGGRIFTTEFSSGLIDLGAQWCHGIEGNLVHALAGSESFVETKMDFTKMTFSWSDGSEADSKSCELALQLCEKILHEIKSEAGGTIDELLTRKFHEALSQHPLKKFDKGLALEILDNFRKRESSYCGCANLGMISIDGYNKFRDCEGPTWLNWKGKGYKTIFDHLLKASKVSRAEVEQKILLNKKVVNIDYRDNSKVKIACDDGTIFLADHVVVTVSIGVLKNSSIFTPELPIEKKEAVEKIPFGAVGKVFVSFNERFWPQDWIGMSLLWREDDLKEIMGTEFSWLENFYCFYAVDFLPNVLLGRLAGNEIAQMEMLSDEEIKKGCDYVFKKFWPGKSLEINSVMTSKWKTNSNFCGTYAYHTDGSYGHTEKLIEPLYDCKQNPRVLFAGEATHDYFFSTVHGAIESGYREAARLIKMY